MNYSRPIFYANATLSAQVLCCKHCISIHLDEYLTKPWLSVKENLVTRNTPTTDPTVLEFIYAIFSKCMYFVRCTECQVSIKAHTYSCQLCSQNLGRLNTRLFEVL